MVGTVTAGREVISRILILCPPPPCLLLPTPMVFTPALSELWRLTLCMFFHSGLLPDHRPRLPEGSLSKNKPKLNR